MGNEKLLTFGRKIGMMWIGMASISDKSFRKLVRENFTLGGAKIGAQHLKALGAELEKHPRLGRGYVANPRKSLLGVANPSSRSQTHSAAMGLFDAAQGKQITIGGKVFRLKTGVTRERLKQQVNSLASPVPAAEANAKAQLAAQQSAQQAAIRGRAMRVAEIQRSLQAEREKQNIGSETSATRSAISRGVLQREVSSLDLGKVNGPLTSAGKASGEPLGLNSVTPVPAAPESGQVVAPARSGQASEDDDDAPLQPGVEPAASAPAKPAAEGDDKPAEPTDLAID